MLLILGLSGVFSGVDVGYKAGEDYSRSDTVFSLHPLKWCMISCCPFPVNVKFGICLKVALPSLSTVRLLFFLL